MTKGALVKGQKKQSLGLKALITVHRMVRVSPSKIVKSFNVCQSYFNSIGPKDTFCLFVYPSRKKYISQYFACSLILRKKNGLSSS